jgi:glutaredoxin 3
VYRDVNVVEDAEARQDLIRMTGQTAIPVIVVGDEVVRGFDRPRLKALLGI